MASLRSVAAHVRKYLLLYVFIAIIIAIPIGYHWAAFFKVHKEQMKWVIVSLAVLTLYPSMVQLKSEKIGSEFKGKLGAILLGLFLVFVLSPLLAMLFADMLPNAHVGIGYVAANSVPASSASIAYVLLAEGNIELATVLAVLSILLAVGIVPAYVGLYAHSVSVSLPYGVLAESVGIALLTPLLLGQLTRYFAVKRKAKALLRHPAFSSPCKEAILTADPGAIQRIEELIGKIEDATECLEEELGRRMKPLLSLWTMISMLFLIGLLIANKAQLLIEKPLLAGEIIGFQMAIYAIIIGTGILGSRLLKMGYEDHMGIIFIGITKNESVAAAVSVLAIGAAAAIPAALIPAIQPVVAILYLGAANGIRRLLG